jgi:AraC-like DNA-binding protein
MASLAVRPRSPALRPFIRSLHYHEIDLPFGLERIVPSGQVHLMVNLAEDEFRTYPRAAPNDVVRHAGAVLAGPHARPVVLDTQEFRWLAAVQFRTGTAALFFPMPMGEAGDQIVSLEHLWRSDGPLLRECLLEARAPQQKFAILESWLLRHLRPAIDPAVCWAVAALRQSKPVAAVAAQLGMQPKTFVRRFSAHTGLTPKLFARVCRLQSVLRAVRQAPALNWCALAAEHGYTDQSHLAHEFRALAGIAPSEYKPASARRGNHIPIAPS